MTRIPIDDDEQPQHDDDNAATTQDQVLEGEPADPFVHVAADEAPTGPEVLRPELERAAVLHAHLHEDHRLRAPGRQRRVVHVEI